MEVVTEPSFEGLVAARGPALLRLALMLTDSREDAEDLLQATLAQAWPHADRIVAMEAPAAYLRTVMVHAHASARRRRRPLVVPLEDQDAPGADGRDLDSAPTLLDRTWRALATLPARQRAVLVLRVYEGLSDRDIADVLGVGESTVRSNASRALDTLRSRFTRADLEEDR